MKHTHAHIHIHVFVMRAHTQAKKWFLNMLVYGFSLQMHTYKHIHRRVRAHTPIHALSHTYTYKHTCTQP